MQTFNSNNRMTVKELVKKATIWLLLLAMTIQLFSVTCFAVTDGGFTFGSSSSSGGSGSSGGISGVGMVAEDEALAALRKDILSTIKDELLHTVDEYQLSGPVSVILTFSENSLIETYASSIDTGKVSFADYRKSNAASKLNSKLISNQNTILDYLLDEGLISEVKHTYTNLLDGAFVRTTYEDLEAICALDGIERVTVSERYLPCEAVENPVNVYDTGIFNSGDVSYTGKGTVVAILDTGCDYTHSAFTTHQVVDPKYDRDDIAAFLPSLRANAYGDALEAREVYYGNITAEKIVYGYDYADKDTDVMPFDNSHGTHVAGIIGGFDDQITGVAIDTQLAIMKVFSDYEQGAEDGDIIAALEDSVVLEVDAINMSLGTSCGFSYITDPEEEYKNDVYSRVETAGISLVVAASNDYSSAFGGENGNTNKTDNPDSATVGSPATYGSSMAVASINGNKDYYMFANGDMEVFFDQSYDMGSNEYDFFEMLGILEGEKKTYEYVTVPGLGLAVNYAGIDVKGKIALVKRGDITFEEKIQYAQEAGAIAVIVYNNIFGHITMTVGNYAKIPAVSITKDDGDILASQPSGTIVFDRSNQAGPFMSAFSSWGPTPDLKLKPEITAHGGNITSAVIGGEYDKLSGTSMAAPNMCGITVLIRQYVMDKYPDYTATQVRDLVNQLCMSTATIALDNKGNPYSPRKQGAGIADIKKSTTTLAYLYVDGINKTKLELGDDPARTGVYEMSINLKNMSLTDAVSYRIGNITMTESISTSDPEYVAEMAYILSNASEYKVEGGTFTDGVVTVAPGATAKITVKLTLSAEDKSYLNSTFDNGMFVEGFLTFDNMDENGVDLNAPFLAFFGNWGDAPIFDLDYYEVETEAHDNAIDDDDKIKADYYATTPLGLYYYDYILPLGSYLYKMDETEYKPIPATREHAAISYFADSISGLYAVYTGLLRNVRELTITIVDADTGNVVYEEIQYDCYKSHYSSGAARPYVAKCDLMAVDYETGKTLGGNNSKYEVTMSAKLDWNGGENRSDTYSFSFYIDYEAPTITEYNFRTEYDKGREENRYYLDLMVYDNHYAMSCRPVTVYEMYFEDDKTTKRTYASLTEYPIPIYQENRGETTKVTMEITDYIDTIANSQMPSGISIFVDDYALNSALYYIPFPETDSEDLEFADEFAEKGLKLDINETFDLATILVHKDTAEAVTTDYLKTLEWSSSDESVVAISGGKIEGLSAGSAVIKVTSDSWTIKEEVDGKIVETPVYKSIAVQVSQNVKDDDPNSGKNAQIEELTFASYKTLFAFSSDVDFSEIGSTNSIHYFDGDYSIACYPSEQIQLTPQLKPWNLAEDRYTLSWTSSNPSVATVNDEGIVTAEAEGKARITLQITIDGKTSLLAARLSVEVKSEFVIENRMLVAYKGKGGDVVIPDDEGILYIGSYAFSHYYIENEREVEKDENGYYDLDDKKDPIGNTTVTSVVIPEGVEKIEKHAFYNSDVLRSVTLPESCETIGEWAFAYCEVLENVNFDNVKIVADHAFDGCESLSCDDLGGANMSGIYTMGDYAFSKTGLNNIELTSLSRVGVGIFSECSKLENVTLGERTRVSEKMFEKTPVKSIVIYGDFISNNAFYECTKLTDVTLKKDVTYLGKNVFYGCTALKNFTAEADVEYIDDMAFYGCTALKSFTLPDCSFSLGNAVFGSSGIEKITFGANTCIEHVGASIFHDVKSVTADLTKSLHYKADGIVIYTQDGKDIVLALPNVLATSVTVPKEVVNVCDGAFSSVANLLNVYFPDDSNLEYIGKNAFANCTALMTVDLPDKTVKIDDSAFYNTTMLRNIDLSNVNYIGAGAFANSGINSAQLVTENIYIGNQAFYRCSALYNVTIGEGATIGEFAFRESGLSQVAFEGDATIGAEAFSSCTNLSSFDFADLTGVLGDYAFYNCTKLTAVDAPKLTGIGKGTFSNCYNLASINLPLVTSIGDMAFTAVGNTMNATSANRLTKLELPLVESIGEHAFSLSKLLTTVDMPKLTSMGSYAFGACDALTSVTYSDGLTVIPDGAFYSCRQLSDLNLENIVTIGSQAMCGVILPADLSLPNVESVGEYAFTEFTNFNYIETVTAPKLTTIANQGFAGCSKLKSLHAPALVNIGESAFVGCQLTEFEVSDSLETLGLGAFSDCKTLEAFYATVEGKKVYSATLENVMIDDGVLYVKNGKGYTLACYPRAKDATEYVIPEGTVKIETLAFYDNTNIEKVTMPSSMRFIANFSFYGCENLETVVFKSYYAPTLEGTMRAMTNDIVIVTPGNVKDFPGFETLYRYDYYYIRDNTINKPYYYSTFKSAVGTKAAEGLTAVLPDNCEGYDSLIYRAYFTKSEETSGITAGKYAIAFVEAVNKLPEAIDRFDKLLMDDAIVAYNALVSRADEMAFVDKALVERFTALRTAYNVDVTTAKIAHIFDVDNSKYSFDIIKDARASYLALSDAERAMVENADVLDTKIAALEAALGKEVDFSLSYEEHLPQDPPVPPTPIDPVENDDNTMTVIIVIAASVVVVALIALGVILFVKKKKASASGKGSEKNESDTASGAEDTDGKGD